MCEDNYKSYLISSFCRRQETLLNETKPRLAARVAPNNNTEGTYKCSSQHVVIGDVYRGEARLLLTHTCGSYPTLKQTSLERPTERTTHYTVRLCTDIDTLCSTKRIGYFVFNPYLFGRGILLVFAIHRHSDWPTGGEARSGHKAWLTRHTCSNKHLQGITCDTHGQLDVTGTLDFPKGFRCQRDGGGRRQPCGW